MDFIDNVKTMNRVTADISVQSHIGKLASLPLTITMLPTLRCNYNCMFCTQDHKSQQEYSEEIVNKIEKLLPFADSVNINGGEPLMYKDIGRLLSLAGRSRCFITMVTNGSLLNEKNRTMLFENGVGKLKISFDGATPQTYKALRRNGSFKNVVSNIAAISEMKAKLGINWPQLHFNFVILQSNVRELGKLVALAKKLGIESIDAQYCRCDNKAAAEQSVFFSQECSNDSLMIAKEMARQLGVKLTTPALFGQKPYEERKRNICRQPFDILPIGVSGNSSLCCSHTKSYGSLATEEAIQVWNHPMRIKVRQTLNTDNELDICRNCSYGSKQDPNLLVSHIPNAELAQWALGQVGRNEKAKCVAV